MREQANDDNEADLTPGERELAGALGGLSPVAPSRLDRDRLLFCAGAATARHRASRQLWAWRGIAAVLAVGIGTAWSVRSPVPSVAPPQFVQRPRTEAVVSPAAPRDADASSVAYLALRQRVLTRGVDAAISAAPTNAAPSPDLGPRLLDLRRRSTDGGGAAL